MFYKEIPESDILQAQRDDFRLPDFTKTLFASGQIRKHWKSKVNQATKAWCQIEKLKLQEGITDSLLLPVNNDRFLQLKQWANKHGVHLIPLDIAGRITHYVNHSVPATRDGHSHVCAVVSRKELIGQWHSVWQAGDNSQIGELLGYPKCCRDFFEEYWVEQQYRDLTIPAIENGDGIQGDKLINILGRWAGYRYTSHMPCSFQCEHSLEIAKQTRQAALDNDMDAEVGLIDTLLDMPYKYTCLHGIAEITTPIYKVSTSSESLPQIYTAERKGTQPLMSASGNQFPFENQHKSKVTESPSFKRSIEAVRGGANKQKTYADPKEYELNGFSSAEAMSAAHKPIVELAKDYEDIVDYGCGNGVLLDKLGGGIGVDTNGEAVGFGNERYCVLLQKSDLFDYDPPLCDCTILMAGRLTEVDESEASNFLKHLAKCSKFVIAYCYGDWKEESNPADIIERCSNDFVQVDEQENEHCRAVKLQSLLSI